jgi:Spy/CpxP family protein refolding chaperone
LTKYKEDKEVQKMSLINKLCSGLTVAAAVFAFSTFTLAQDDKAKTAAPDKEKAEKHFKGQGRGMHKGRGEGMGFGNRHAGIMRMMHELNLTEAQKTQIHSIMEASKPDQSVRDEMKTLFEAKRSGTLTAEQQARFETLKEQAKAKRQAVHEQIQAVLTAEQKAQIEQKHQQMKQLRQERRLRREQRQNAPAAATETTKEN